MERIDKVDFDDSPQLGGFLSDGGVAEVQKSGSVEDDSVALLSGDAAGVERTDNLIVGCRYSFLNKEQDYMLSRKCRCVSTRVSAGEGKEGRGEREVGREKI